MQHRRELDAELTRGVDAGAELEGLEHLAGLVGLPQAAPERGVEQDHVHRVMLDAACQLLEIHHHGIGGGGDGNAVAQPPHAFEPEARVLEIIVADMLDFLGDPDRVLDRPHRIGVEPEAVAGQRFGNCREHFDIVLGGEHATLQLVRLEAVQLLLPLGFLDQRVGRELVAKTVLLVAVAIEQVAGERNPFAQRPADQVAGAHPQRFAGHVHAGHFQCRMHLHA